MSEYSRRLTGLRSGTTGVMFASLKRFSEPLWGFYDLSADAVLESAQKSEAEALEVAVSVLETARIAWSYFRNEERDYARSVLRTNLIGEETDVESVELWEEIIDALRQQFEGFSDSEIREAESVPGKSALDIQELLAYFENGEYATPEIDDSDEDESDGATVLAMFAAPLMESSDIENPEELELIMNKAGDYWQLAQATPEEQRSVLELIKQTYARTAKEAKHIETEALQMVRRYQELFS